jgi:hypothetical protein
MAWKTHGTMTPPAGSENQSNLPKAIDTEKMYREMAEQENPAKLLEMRQEAEKRLAEAKHARERASTAAERSAARADVLTTPAQTAPAAPSASPSAAPSAPPATPAQTPSAAPSSPDKSPESSSTPPSAPAENAPAKPPATPPSTTETPPASPPAASNPPNTPPPTPEASGEKSLGAKFSEFFTKLWEGLSKVIEGITTKISNWFSGKKTEQTPAATTSPPSTPTPAPAPGVSPPSGPPPPSPERYRDLVKPSDADSTWGLTKGALFNHPQFKAKTEQIAAKIGGGIVAGDLYDIFMMECMGEPQNPPSPNGAAGLIQWIPPTARSIYNLSTEQIRRMSGLQQLDLVDKYFSPYAGRLHTFPDLYRVVLYPVSIGKSQDFILGSEKKDPTWKITVARSNPGISLFGTVPATLNGQQVMINRNVRGKRQDVPLMLIDNRALDKYCASRRGKGSSLVRGGSPALVA